MISDRRAVKVKGEVQGLEMMALSKSTDSRDGDVQIFMWNVRLDTVRNE